MNSPSAGKAHEPRRKPSVKNRKRTQPQRLDGADSGRHHRKGPAAPIGDDTEETRNRKSAARAGSSGTAIGESTRGANGKARYASRRRATSGEAAGATGKRFALGAAAIDEKHLVLGAAAALVVLAALVAFMTLGRAGEAESEPVQDVAAEQQTGKATGPFSISFASTGDLIFWREVADYIDENGGASAMANIADTLAAADVTIANVESPLSDNESEPITDKDVYIIGRPSAIESIKNSDITLASLANNHIMDYGAPALEDTLAALDGAGVLHAGAGMTEEDASAFAETTVNGASIAFFSWTDIVPDYFLAFGKEPGVVSARMNMDDACKRVREAKETHDIVIVAMHWGVEYEPYITDYLQSEPAHKLVDAGADVILGNHPHVIEGIEFYKDSLIAYAQGNCVFCQAYDYTHESYLLNFDITENGIQNVVATPLYLSDDHGIPDFATGEQAQTTLARLEEISEGMNATFDIRDDKAYVTPATA